MPTERFRRLPEEKKSAIYRSLQKEFARVPFEQASINRIVQDASISRGSFYTYFADKYDALCYVMEETLETVRQHCGEVLRDNRGEYLGMIRSLFEYLVTHMQSTGELLNIVKNMAHDMPDSLVLRYGEEELKEPDGIHKASFSQWVMDHIAHSRLRVQSKSELNAMVELGYLVLLRHICEYYRHPERLDSIRIMLDLDLDIIRRGAYRMAAAC